MGNEKTKLKFNLKPIVCSMSSDIIYFQIHTIHLPDIVRV